MCNLTSNLPPLPAIFSDKMAPVVRTAPDAVRELTMMRWGFAPPIISGQKSARPVTNIRNTSSRHWTPWLMKAEHRCSVPVTCFSEPDSNQGLRSIWTWFAQNESRPFMFFAGVWRKWETTSIGWIVRFAPVLEPLHGRPILSRSRLEVGLSK
jgi:putative SOS response-associated peptidase YedK